MYQTIVREQIMKNASPQTQNHIVLKTMNGDELGTLLYAKSYDAETKQLSMITVQQFGEGGKLQQVENADTAIWNGQYLGDAEMVSSMIYQLVMVLNVPWNLREQSLPIKSAPKDIQQDQRKPEELTIKELRHQIRAYKAAYTNANKLEWKCTNALQFRWQVLYLLS